MGSTSQKLLIYWKRRFRGIDVWVFNQKGQSTLEKKWQGKEVYVLSKWVISNFSVKICNLKEWDFLRTWCNIVRITLDLILLNDIFLLFICSKHVYVCFYCFFLKRIDNLDSAKKNLPSKKSYILSVSLFNSLNIYQIKVRALFYWKSSAITFAFLFA